MPDEQRPEPKLATPELQRRWRALQKIKDRNKAAFADMARMGLAPEMSSFLLRRVEFAAEALFPGLPENATISDKLERILNRVFGEDTADEQDQRLSFETSFEEFVGEEIGKVQAQVRQMTLAASPADVQRLASQKLPSGLRRPV